MAKLTRIYLGFYKQYKITLKIICVENYGKHSDSLNGDTIWRWSSSSSSFGTGTLHCVTPVQSWLHSDVIVSVCDPLQLVVFCGATSLYISSVCYLLFNVLYSEYRLQGIFCIVITYYRECPTQWIQIRGNVW